MTTYHVIRSPESQGRPEKYIADAVVDQLIERLDYDSVISHSADGDSPDPVNGADFYTGEATARMLEMAARSVNSMADGDKVFVMDAQAPVVPIIRYLCLLKGIDVKIIGLFHSSCATPGDMFYNSDRARLNETTTLQSLDLVLSATAYLTAHLKSIYHRASTFTLHGLPMDHLAQYKEYALPWAEREDVCVWPHRLAADKGKEMMAMVARDVPVRILTPTPLDPEYTEQAARWGIQIKVCPDRLTYFKELGKAKVVLSTAVLETFGYAMMEGAAMGCTPVVPDRACYSEQYSLGARYLTEDCEGLSPTAHCIERCRAALDGDEHPKAYVKMRSRVETAAELMARVIIQT